VGLTLGGWKLDNDEWLATESLGLTSFSVVSKVPSLSPTGAELLMGLIFAIGIAELAATQRGRAG
jgi:hypothetical protein